MLYRLQCEDFPSSQSPPLQSVFWGVCSSRPGQKDLLPSRACDVAWASGASLSHSLVLGIWTRGPENDARHPQPPGP